MRTRNSRLKNTATAHDAASPSMLPGQNVLVLQGGGALGAYQIGVYQAMHEAGIEPDWVIGTSIGAINAAIIADNAPDQRLQRLNEFWDRVEHSGQHAAWGSFGTLFSNWFAVTRGIESFFVPRPAAWISPHIAHDVEKGILLFNGTAAENLDRAERYGSPQRQRATPDRRRG